MLFSSTLQVRDSGRRLCVIIVAEGAQDVAGNPVKSDHIREVRLGRFMLFIHQWLLTLALPRGLPLTSKIVWRRQ